MMGENVKSQDLGNELQKERKLVCETLEIRRKEGKGRDARSMVVSTEHTAGAIYHPEI
jgi:hypothetical protein